MPLTEAALAVAGGSVEEANTPGWTQGVCIYSPASLKVEKIATPSPTA
ncbi:MAG: hypothetical protein QXR64_04275 [Pyrobaculum sp.]